MEHPVADQFHLDIAAHFLQPVRAEIQTLKGGKMSDHLLQVERRQVISRQI